MTLLRGKDTLNLRLLDKYVHEHTLDELRVTLIDKEGKVLYDNIEQNPLYFSNHLNREEIKEGYQPRKRLFQLIANPKV